MQLWTKSKGTNDGPGTWALAVGLARTLLQITRGFHISPHRVEEELYDVAVSQATDPVDALALIVLALAMIDEEGNETARALLSNAVSGLEQYTGFPAEMFSGGVRVEH